MSSVGYQPLVSVVIATYNRAALVKRAVESALAQTETRLEIVVSDDCSPDNTFEVLNALGDLRVRVQRQPANVGVWENWTAALHRARGEFIIFLGDDDWLTPNFITTHLDLLEQDQTLAATFSPMTEVSSHGEPGRRFVPELPVRARTGQLAFLRPVLTSNLFFGAAVFRRETAIRFWNQTRADDWVADVGLMLRMALDPTVTVSAVEGCEYFKTMSQRNSAHAQLSGQYLKVTRALHDVLVRVMPLSRSPATSRLLAREASQQGIVLARHHAAAGDPSNCRRWLWKSAQLAPVQLVVWSQLLQTYLCPARLMATAKQQRVPDSSPYEA